MKKKSAGSTDADRQLDLYDSQTELDVGPVDSHDRPPLERHGGQFERYDGIPDVRDGLTRKERVVLYVLHQTQKERGDRNVPTAMLWGRVCEYFYISPEALSEMLARLGAQRW